MPRKISTGTTLILAEVQRIGDNVNAALCGERIPAALMALAIVMVEQMDRCSHPDTELRYRLGKFFELSVKAKALNDEERTN